MSLIDEINQIQEESYDKWFERWYPKQNFEKDIIQSAQEGYYGIFIPIKNRHDDEMKWDREQKYQARRLRDTRTPGRIERNLGKGFKVEHVVDKHTVKLLGNAITRVEDKLSISWKLRD